MQKIVGIYALSKRNVLLRYKNSIAGFFWGFFKPLIYLLIFIVVFSSQFTSVDNYVLFATSGLIAWFFFANVTGQSVQNIIGSAGLIKAINIPSIFFPLSELLSELFNLLLMLAVYLVVMYWFGIDYDLKLLLLIPAVLLFSVFSLGVTLVLSSLNVFFRDVGILWNTFQPGLFYLTPIAYPESLIPEKFRFVVQCNPVYYFIKLIRGIIYDAQQPSLGLWMSCIVISVATMAIGYFVFRKLSRQFISAI